MDCGGCCVSKASDPFEAQNPPVASVYGGCYSALKKIKQASLFFGLPSSVSCAASVPAEEAGT